MQIHSFFNWNVRSRLRPSRPCLAAARRGPPAFDGRGGNPFGGNPFGGNPFGGNPFGVFRHRGRARRGDVRSAILLLLAEQPRNGYQVMQEIELRSRGVWRPSPGSVYPALQQLEDEGLVRVEVSATGKVFHLTDAGYAESKASAGEPLLWDGQSEPNDEASELGSLIRQVVLAAAQVAQAGTPHQLAEARKLLTEVRRNLYKLLATDDEAGDDGQSAATNEPR